jgi:hypothetical protein
MKRIAGKSGQNEAVQVAAELKAFGGARVVSFGMCERCERHGARAPFGLSVVRSLAAFCEYAGHEGTR